MLLRTEKQLSQEDIARFLKITRQAYSRYERGEREANYETLNKLATFFDVSIDYLLGRTTYYYPDNVRLAATMGDSYTPEERQIIDEYRKLPDTSKVLVRRMVGIKETSKN